MDELQLRLFQQLLECLAIDGFDEVRIESGALRASQVALATPAGQRNNARTPPRPDVCSKPLADLETVDLGHTEIEEDDIGVEVLCSFQGQAPLEGGGDFVSHGSKEPGDGGGAIAIVIDYEEARGGCGGGGGHGDSRQSPGRHSSVRSGR